MKGWDDKIAELFLRGRVRDTFDKPKLAREWNTGNCEPVRLTSGRPMFGNSCPQPSPAHEQGPLTPSFTRTGEYVDTDQCREGGVVNQPTPARSPSLRAAPTPSATPLYPVVGLCRATGLPEPTPEYQFAREHGRKWRADYCWPLHKLILEIEGGLWTNGRHSRGKGAIADLEKYSEAAILGYRVIYATPDEVRNGVALDRIVRALTDQEAA